MVIPMDCWMEDSIMCSLDAWFSQFFQSFSKLAIVTSILHMFSFRNQFIFKGRQKIETTAQCAVLYWMSESETFVRVHHPLSWKGRERKCLRRLGFMVTVQPTDVAEQNVGKFLNWTYHHTENLIWKASVSRPQQSISCEISLIRLKGHLYSTHFSNKRNHYISSPCSFLTEMRMSHQGQQA